MSKKNPLAELTAEHGLKRCSMGRCCNAAEIDKLTELLIEACKLAGEYHHEGHDIFFNNPEVEKYWK